MYGEEGKGDRGRETMKERRYRGRGREAEDERPSKKRDREADER